MRRSHGIVAAFGAALLLSLALFAGASTSAADTGPLAVQTAASSDKTASTYGVGGGQTDIGTQNFDLSAHQRPNGKDFGHWGVVVTNSVTGDLIVRYRVDVSCVNIHAPDRGVIKGEVRSVEPTPNTLGVTEGETIILGIKDGGNQSGPTPVDDFFTPHTDVFPGLSCKFITYVGTFNNVTQGNVNIKLG